MPLEYLGCCCFIRDWANYSALWKGEQMHSNFQEIIVEDLKKLIMVSIWKCFPENMKKYFGSADSYMQVMVSLCVLHLHSSKSCCIRCWLWNTEQSYYSVENLHGVGGALQSEGLFIISVESLKWAEREMVRSSWAGNPLKLQKQRENEQIFRQCCKASRQNTCISYGSY